MIKIGDKVRFLNSTGGGIVTKIIKNIAHVEEEDGFETPVLITECVVIESRERNNTPSAPAPAPKNNTPVPAPPIPHRQEEVPVIETSEGNKLNITLAFVPEDIKRLQNGNFDTYLVNDSNYFIAFSYLNKVGDKWNLRYTTTVEPNIKIHIEEFSHTDLNELEEVCIQYIAFKKNKLFELKDPASVSFRIDTVKFYKLHAFKENDYFDTPALVYPIAKEDIPARPLYINADDIQNAMREKKIETENARQPISKKANKNAPVLEVDLHIEELIDSTTGMNNADILEYQKNEFLRIMEQYKDEKGKKIVFIHGKGDGVLRNEIIKELKNKYRNCYFQDASFREYGFGATMITIK